ncbi:hypothetical protein ACO0SA_003738 [Hanseniaspora valbyensis]
MRNFQLSLASVLLLSKLTNASPVLTKKEESSQDHIAPEISNNPTDVVYRADFPFFNSPNVVGIVQFYSINGTAKVHVDLTGLPKNAGLFSYHVHENGIPYDTPDQQNACEYAGLHFNPFQAPLASNVNCDSFEDDSKCQVGDLSGKHGLINTTCFETYYYDPYISLNPNDPAFIGGKSLVIHLEDNSKLACANIIPSSEPEDLVLINPESEIAQINDFIEASTGDKTKVYDFEGGIFDKRDDNYDMYEDLDWGFEAEEEEDDGADYEDGSNDEFELHDGDKDMKHSVDVSPVATTGNSTNSNVTSFTNGTGTNSTQPLSSNAVGSVINNLHLWDSLRIVLVAMFMVLF